MDVRLDGKVAIVTGGSRGIGRAIAEEFIRSGAGGVVVTSRRAENAEQAAAEISEATGAPDRVEAVVARADSVDDAHRTVAFAVERFGAVDILVNNAGTNPAAGPLTDVDLGAVDKTWQVNQRGPLVWSQAAWHGWMRDHGGCIVNTASVGGLRPGPLIGAYNISKAALVFMTYQLAMEMAPGVRVNAVAPAVVRTRLSELLWTADPEGAAALHPLGRLGEVEDVAWAVTFLVSDKASWITGVCLPVDGGQSGAKGIELG